MVEVADVALAHQQAGEVLQHVLGVDRIDRRFRLLAADAFHRGRDLRRQRSWRTPVTVIVPSVRVVCASSSLPSGTAGASSRVASSVGVGVSARAATAGRARASARKSGAWRMGAGSVRERGRYCRDRPATSPAAKRRIGKRIAGAYAAEVSCQPPGPSRRAVTAMNASPSPASSFRARAWRWHFLAALLVVPFILWQSVTGTLYLWSYAWVDYAHADLRFVEPAPRRTTLDAQFQPPAMPCRAAASKACSCPPTRRAARSSCSRTPTACPWPCSSTPIAAMCSAVSTRRNGGRLDPQAARWLAAGRCRQLAARTGRVLDAGDGAQRLGAVVAARTRRAVCAVAALPCRTPGALARPACLRRGLVLAADRRLPAHRAAWTSFWGGSVLRPIQHAAAPAIP